MAGESKQDKLLSDLGFSEAEARAGHSLPGLGGNQVEQELLQEVKVTVADVIQQSRENLNFLAALATPEVFKFNYPVILLGVWGLLLEYAVKTRDFSKILLGLPRGFGKTMMIKLYILWLILFTDRRFILVICENEKKAINILSDVTDMLNEPNIIRTFGDWKLGLETDQLALKKFGFRGRNVILMAAGQGTGVRGITLKNERPDVMIFDDIQSREAANSPTEFETLENWFHGTALKAKSPIRCLYIFVGNMYPTKYSLLRKLKYNPTWIKFTAGGILADGTSLWEELQPLKQLLSEFENDLISGKPEIFYSEVLNDENASSNHLIDLSKLPQYPFEDDDFAVGKFIIIDPASGKVDGDAISIGYFEVHDTKPCLLELEEGRFSPGETIRRAIQMCLRRGCRLVVIESNAYQYTLNYWFTFICQQMQITELEAVEIYSGAHSKISRILTMFKSLVAGEIYYHPRCKALVDLQITQFNPLKKDNTDGILDLLTYAPRVLELYPDAIQAGNVIAAEEWQAIGVVEHNSSF